MEISEKQDHVGQVHKYCFDSLGWKLVLVKLGFGPNSPPKASSKGGGLPKPYKEAKIPFIHRCGTPLHSSPHARLRCVHIYGLGVFPPHDYPVSWAHIILGSNTMQLGLTHTPIASSREEDCPSLIKCPLN